MLSTQQCSVAVDASRQLSYLRSTEGVPQARPMRIRRILYISFLLVASIATSAQEVLAPEPQAGTITGSVEDTSGAAIPEAFVTLTGKEMNEQTVRADQSGLFTLQNVRSALPLNITVRARGLAEWNSPAFTLASGQYFELINIDLKVADVETTVNAIMPEELALKQVRGEEKQRILGVIPNFCVVYDNNPMPMTTKLKYQLALDAGPTQ
jgi:hypothetical protein